MLMLVMMFALLPLALGIALLFMSRRRGRGYPACGQCGYNVSGTLGTGAVRCPACGSDFAQVGVLPAVTRPNRGVMWIGIVLLALPVLCVGWGGLMAFVTARERAAVQAANAQATAAAAAATRAASAARARNAQAPPRAVQGPADPALVAKYRAQVAAMTPPEISRRANEIAMLVAQGIAAGTLDETSAAELNAELGALRERLPAASEPNATAPASD